MAKEQVASEPSSPAPAAKTQPPANPVRRLTLIVMAIGIVLFTYGIAADRITPYTAQALVQAYLVKIAPEVSGRVIEVGVDTDQRVEAGKVLFRIEPDQYVLAVRRAEAQLETIGQSIGASTAAVATAQAKLVEAIALRENARDQTKRIFELVKKGVHSEARRTQAQASLDSAEAIVEQAQAELEKAKQTLGPTGADNPQIREAMTVLAQANLDLQRTTVLAPSEGGVTNLSLGIGQVLSKGEAAMTYIDIREVWIEAAFREVSLENIHIGDPVEIVLDLYPGRVFAGRVSAVGYGVGNRDVDARTGLPSPRSQSGWIRPPQPMPVRVEFDGARPVAMRVGSQAKVMVYPDKNLVMNVIGYVRMRLAALLAYVQ
jgi:multidrug resistance efflux pump